MSAYGSKRGRQALTESILEGFGGESIQDQIDAELGTAKSATTGTGSTMAEDMLADTESTISDMKQRSLGARMKSNKEVAEVKKDKGASFSRDWMALLMGHEEKFKDENATYLSDKIAAESVAPISEVDSDEVFLRTGALPEDEAEAEVVLASSEYQSTIPMEDRIFEPEEEGVSTGSGLMSKRLDGKDGDLETSYDEMEMDSFLDDFIPEMAELEGMGGDVVLGDLEPTYSYGITEEKANEYGMQPEDYENMEDFARAFAARYRKEKEEMYPDIFTNDLNKDIERGLQSYLWNRGSFYPGQLRELNNGNYNGFIDELKDVVNARDRGVNGNPSRPMSGLSKRRAAEANLVGRGIEGYVPIATVETAGTRQSPVFIWKDAQGNEQNSFTSTRPLHSSSELGEIRVPL